MKKILLIVGLTVLSGLSATAQNPSVVPAAPPATCFSGIPLWSVYSTGTLYVCNNGTPTAIGGGGGSGTVTSFSAGTLSPLFTTSVATPTTTPALTFSLSTAAANTVFGNFTGSTAVPTFSATPVFAITSLTGTCTACTANAVPAANLTGATLASGVTASSLTSLGGGTVGTAAFVATGTSGATIPLLNGANTYSGASTFSAAETISVAGAASTPGLAITGTPFVGSGTTSTPQLYINNSANAPTTWNSSATGGTYFGINSQSGFAGNYFDFHVNGGASFFSLASTGNMNTSGSIKGSAFLTATNCAVNSASPAACGSAATGAFVVPTSTTTYTVTTSAVTAKSRIMLQPITFAADLPTSPTCVAPLLTVPVTVSAISAATNFTITLASTTGQTCFYYTIFN